MQGHIAGGVRQFEFMEGFVGRGRKKQQIATARSTGHTHLVAVSQKLDLPADAFDSVCRLSADFLAGVPIKSIRFLGGKLGKQLRENGLETMGEI